MTEAAEIDLEAIAYHIGARVRYRCLAGCEAHIIGSQDNALITIHAHGNTRRKRFSIAHELGHWHHHRGKRLVCRVDGLQTRGPLSPERVANGYAADLLMPDYLFRGAARRHSRLDFKIISLLANEFAVSSSAAAIRLVEIDHAPALLICHGPKGRKWFISGPQVPARWFPRQDLDPESLAFDVLSGARPNDTMPHKIDASAWFDHFEASRFEVKEQTIRTGEDESLTLLLITDGDMLEELSH